MPLSPSQKEELHKDKLCAATELFHASVSPSLIKIKNFGLPEFSGMSFVSKIRMFLDPEKSATLDRQIMKIHPTFYGSRECPCESDTDSDNCT